MKTVCSLIVFAITFGMSCSAQELKTVEACRTYRDAWFTSVDADTASLSISELTNRADQLMTCGKEIDRNPFKAGMTQAEALDIAIDSGGYAILSTAYYQEAFLRAAWFIDNKHLTHELITDDKNGRIIRSKLPKSPDK